MKKRNIWIIICIIISALIICGIWYMHLSEKKSDSSKDKTMTGESETEDEDMYNEKEIPIYTINYDTLECEPSLIVASDTATISARYIVDEVIANFREHISIHDVFSENDRIIVSFSKDSAPAVNVSKDMESVMLDCISYSLLDNIENCNSVGFRIEDKAYESSYITMEYDESYVEK